MTDEGRAILLAQECAAGRVVSEKMRFFGGVLRYWNGIHCMLFGGYFGLRLGCWIYERPVPDGSFLKLLCQLSYFVFPIFAAIMVAGLEIIIWDEFPVWAIPVFAIFGVWFAHFAYPVMEPILLWSCLACGWLSLLLWVIRCYRLKWRAVPIAILFVIGLSYVTTLPQDTMDRWIASYEHGVANDPNAITENARTAASEFMKNLQLHDAAALKEITPDFEAINPTGSYRYFPTDTINILRFEIGKITTGTSSDRNTPTAVVDVQLKGVSINGQAVTAEEVLSLCSYSLQYKKTFVPSKKWLIFPCSAELAEKVDTHFPVSSNASLWFSIKDMKWLRL